MDKEQKLKSLKAEVKKLNGTIAKLEREVFKEKLPEDGIILDGWVGVRYPMFHRYYGIIVSDKPAIHIYDERKYVIQVMKYNETMEDSRITRVTCKHGDF